MKHPTKSCYLCSSQDFIVRDGKVRDNPSLDILECGECGLVCLSDDKHITDNHYENSGLHTDAVPDVETWLKVNEADDVRRLDFCKEKISNKDIIDFGCGIGGFIEKALKCTKSASGIELETAFAHSFEKRGLMVFHNIETAKATGKKWDIVTAFHVVEHLNDPRALLTEMSELLNKDGELIVEVPSSNDALLTHYKCKEFQEFTYWSQHLFLFNIETFTELIAQAGLELLWIKGVQRYPLSNHLYWLAKGEPGGHQIWGAMNDPELDAAYEAKLSSFGLTDTIIAGIKRRAT